MKTLLHINLSFFFVFLSSVVSFCAMIILIGGSIVVDPIQDEDDATM